MNVATVLKLSGRTQANYGVAAESTVHFRTKNWILRLRMPHCENNNTRNNLKLLKGSDSLIRKNQKSGRRTFENTSSIRYQNHSAMFVRIHKHTDLRLNKFPLKSLMIKGSAKLSNINLVIID
jgi:hypothetical protein